MDKLPLNTVLAAIDRKQYDFYDGLTDEHRKQLAPFLLNRYASLVQGHGDVQAYYCMAVNSRVNTQYFELAKHPKLIWQLLCTVSPGMGTHRHVWVGHKKRETKTDNKHRKYIDALYPHAKPDELEILYKLWSVKDVRDHQKQSGE